VFSKHPEILKAKFPGCLLTLAAASHPPLPPLIAPSPNFRKRRKERRQKLKLEAVVC
jgi:hypothetical protein